LILSILKKILNGSSDDRYVTKLDFNGLKVIDGSSLKFTDIPNCVGGSGQYCNISGKDSDKSQFGLAKLDNTELTNISKNETYLYISKGALDIAIDDKSCVSKAGDLVLIPKEANVTVKASETVELVYSLTE